MDKFVALLTNCSLTWKNLYGANTPAYFFKYQLQREKDVLYNIDQLLVLNITFFI